MKRPPEPILHKRVEYHVNRSSLFVTLITGIVTLASFYYSYFYFIAPWLIQYLHWNLFVINVLLPLAPVAGTLLAWGLQGAITAISGHYALKAVKAQETKIAARKANTKDL